MPAARRRRATRWSACNGPTARPGSGSRSRRWRQTIHAAGGKLLVDAAQMPAGADADDAGTWPTWSWCRRTSAAGRRGWARCWSAISALIAPTGGQERGYRAGTENLPGALGFAAAVEEPEPDHATLRARLDDALRRSGAMVVGDGQPRAIRRSARTGCRGPARTRNWCSSTWPGSRCRRAARVRAGA